jgi:hypothetical protein
MRRHELRVPLSLGKMHSGVPIDRRMADVLFRDVPEDHEEDDGDGKEDNDEEDEEEGEGYSE